jgi:hypothetical protein
MAYSRISARRSQEVSLETTFYRGGIPTDPFAIYKIEIYRGSVATANLIETIDLPGPDDPTYPTPVSRFVDGSGTDLDGQFALVWDVPSDVVVPDVYFDVWYFWGNDPRSNGTGGTDGLDAFTSSLLTVCNKFWIYPDQWYADGGLETVRFGFEPLDLKFNKPEIRPLEVGIMPLPLYDYNCNLVNPLIPYITWTITIMTENCETVVLDAPLEMKIRQGSYRSNPWVVSYLLDSGDFLKGTYLYRITGTLPDGTTRVSGDFVFTVR